MKSVRLVFCVYASALAVVSGCSGSEPNESDIDGEAAAQKEEPLNSVGVERIVPLRMVRALNCNPTSSSCTWKTIYKDILRSVEFANHSFKDVGIQFYLKSFEGYYMPDFSDLSNSTKLEWSAVLSQFKQVLPNIPDTEWVPGYNLSPQQWLGAVNAVVAARDNPSEYLVWIVDTIPGATGVAYLPENGRSLILRALTFQYEPPTLSHELGHCFGLVHTFSAGTLPLDPQTLNRMTLWDRWDHVYKPGTKFAVIPNPTIPHKFFASKAEAQAYPESELAVIDTNGNCSHNGSTGEVTCTIQPCTNGYCRSETHVSGSSALRGLAFSYAPSSEFQGAAAMSYFASPSHSVSFSTSEAQIVRRYLRWSVPVNSSYKPGQTLSANLPLLGTGNVRQLADDLDVDCDGQRDIAIWEPPTTISGTGKFIVLMSSKGFSTIANQYMSVAFGAVGDIPMVAEMTGDCAADLVVFQPGGGVNRDDPTSTQGHWRICSTNAANPVATTCTAPTVKAFGSRGDIPLPNLHSWDTGTPYLATFTPATGQWKWKVANLALAITTTRTLGGPGSILLPGQYDGDTETDLAVYNPSTGDFVLLRSELNWTSPITRSFGSQYVAQTSGSSQDRAGAIPLSGMERKMLVGLPHHPTYVLRNSFSLYFPFDGTWNTMYDPVGGSPVETCAHVSGDFDIPIAGIDFNSDHYSDMVVFRPSSTFAIGALYFKSAAPGSCGVVEKTVLLARPLGTRVIPVKDMHGDDLPEIMILTPGSNVIQWLSSESGYQTIQSRTIGTHHAEVL